MALTNSQHDYLMRIYEQKQLDNENRLRRRFDEVYQKIPEIKTLDNSISELSLEQARRIIRWRRRCINHIKAEAPSSF